MKKILLGILALLASTTLAFADGRPDVDTVLPLGNNKWLSARRAGLASEVVVLKVDNANNLTINTDTSKATIFQVGEVTKMTMNGTGLGYGIVPTHALNVFSTSGSESGAAVFVNNSGADANSGIRINAATGVTHYNWMLGAQVNVGAAFEITPSTAVGGTTFSTPSLIVAQSGNITTPGDVILSATGKTISIQEATASSACMGSSTPNGTTPVTVTTSCAVAGSRVFISRNAAITNLGTVTVTTSPNGTSFAYASTNASDTAASSVIWFIVKESA